MVLSINIPLNKSSPFQRADLYEDDYDLNKSGEDYEAHSKFTSQHDDSVSHFGSESYAPLPKTQINEG